jgi:8-oxo-dGTP pyrophosphatase MutT (NUDIX family)
MALIRTPYLDRVRAVLRDYQPRRLDEPALKPAAVLLLLSHYDGADRLLLTRRTDTVEHHKGQISFPGGGVDPEDGSLAETALRETWEEVGVRPEDIEIVGRIDDAITVSNYLVAPYVGIMRAAPYEFVTSDFEVAEVLEPPLAHLLDDANREMEARDQDGCVTYSAVYIWNEHRIWGATARMLTRFLDVIRAVDHRAAFEEGTR